MTLTSAAKALLPKYRLPGAVKPVIAIFCVFQFPVGISRNLSFSGTGGAFSAGFGGAVSAGFGSGFGSGAVSAGFGSGAVSAFVECEEGLIGAEKLETS